MKKFAYLTAAVLAASLLSACSGTDNLAKPTPLKTFKPSLHFKKVWGHNTGTTASQYLNIAIGHDQQNVYVVSGKGVVQAYNAQSGKEMWHQALDTPIAGGVSVAQHLAVVSSRHGDIYALSTRDGHVIWQKNINGVVLAPAAISKQAVFVKTINDNVLALSAADGKTLWSDAGNPPSLVLRGGGQPQLFADYLAVGTAAGQIQVYKQSDGSKLWSQQIAEPKGSFDIERMVDVTVAPIITGDALYAAAFQGNLVGYSLKDGSELWQHKLSAYTGMTVDATHLYISAANGDLYAFNKTDGVSNWKLTALYARGITAPALLADTLIVGDEQGYVHAINKSTGRFVARQRATTKTIRSAPVIVGDEVFVLDVAGHLFAYRLEA